MEMLIVAQVSTLNACNSKQPGCTIMTWRILIINRGFFYISSSPNVFMVEENSSSENTKFHNGRLHKQSITDNIR